METKYNYQIKKANDKRDWHKIEAIQRPSNDRVTAIIYGRRLARVFNAEIRMTEGDDPGRASETYISDKCE